MFVVFRTGYSTRLAGSGDFLYSFFSTVSKLLEPKGWGTRFPYLLRHFCDYGAVKYEDAPLLEKEVEYIKKRLKKIPVSYAVYDYEYPQLPIPFEKTEYYNHNTSLDSAYCVGEEKYGYDPITDLLLRSASDSVRQEKSIELTTFMGCGHRELESAYVKRGRGFLKGEYPILFESITEDIDKKIEWYLEPKVSDRRRAEYNKTLASLRKKVPITYHCYVQEGLSKYTEKELDKLVQAYKQILQTDYFKFIFVDKDSPEEDPNIPLEY